MFLHVNTVHLLGNMYFLYILGDNVEDRLGRARFLALYLASGIAGGLLHAWMASGLGTSEPMVGASGAIAGVMGAYAVLFPKTRLISLLLFWRVRWRATTYMALWFALQVVGAISKLEVVAWWAHIGGIVTGAAIARAMYGSPRR
jgi:membrane associated rhomboid family serine protease